MTDLTTAPAATSDLTGRQPVLPPLRLGRHVIESPVVLAPMAGITNRAFRRLCREYGQEGTQLGGASGATSLYVSEMITSRALVERTPETMRLIEHDADEHPRSIQLYSVDPGTAREVSHSPGSVRASPFCAVASSSGVMGRSPRMPRNSFWSSWIDSFVLSVWTDA